MFERERERREREREKKVNAKKKYLFSHISLSRTHTQIGGFLYLDASRSVPSEFDRFIDKYPSDCVWVGHLSPDTDAYCSAVAAAELFQFWKPFSFLFFSFNVSLSLFCVSVLFEEIFCFWNFCVLILFPFRGSYALSESPNRESWQGIKSENGMAQRVN